MEANETLPFLDIQIQRFETGFRTSVYRKACNTGQAVPFSSYTDPKYLQNAVAAEVLRALRYCREPKLLQAELNRGAGDVLGLGYPRSFVEGVMKRTKERLALKARALPAPPELDPVHEPRLSVPYFGPASTPSVAAPRRSEYSSSLPLAGAIHRTKPKPKLPGWRTLTSPSFGPH